ncbi:PstS family phosphate ABC transporter substrate-binding protein [Streptomyces sp. NPDC052040]|uniref:PstS family phosphate ABC transporter substrate-binding protein n=1 Tax=Streptomyces sp. NPDC052040 TaxID=3365682 RepID=UPI0037CCDB5D
MQWFSAENIVAVGTAVLGIVASGAMVWYERRVPRRKRVGYRVQMDNPIGDDVRSGRANRRLGLFDETPGMADATLVLLRIENDGSQGIDGGDYTGPEPHGLTAVFTDRTIRGVSVTQPTDADHLMDHFTAERGFGYEGNRLRIPRVPLNRGDHFKLLVLLSGGDVGSGIRLTGGIREGEVHPNRSATPDEQPPLFSRAARLISITLTLSVLTLAGIVIARDDHPLPLGCARGTLTVTGSTAFAPVVRELAQEYGKKCAGADITVDAHGSEAGVGELTALRPRSRHAPALIAFSDGATPRADAARDLTGSRIAVSAFTLVVNEDVDLGRGLSLAQVRRIYDGRITRWRQLDPRLPDLPVVLVSRTADSGTRQIFQRRVLGTWERVPSTSLDCVHRDDRSAPVTRCELGSTQEVLDRVAAIPGAIGYSELNLALGHRGLRRVSLDGAAASGEDIEYRRSGYPYRGVEYAYTYGRPPTGSLTARFLAYVGQSTGEDVIRAHGHLPCSAPAVAPLCADDDNT